STGYHRFVLELLLYSFILCRANGIEIEERYWRKLGAMLDYMRAYLRPCGRAPLVGDSDGGQLLPIVNRSSDDHAYVLALGAAALKEPRFKVAAQNIPEELLWFSGAQGIRDYESLPASVDAVGSQAFEKAGIYIMRENDSYLLFNASDSGLGGRGSHGHNDALSIEVSACGSLFIVDPGTYAYRADYHGRHLFRSTAYHSTVEVDGAEQNTIDQEWLFFIGNEARPRALLWETTPERDIAVAEHYGYKRLSAPVLHRRSVRFDKRERYWTIEDSLMGEGEHVFRFHFHIADRIETSIRADAIVCACDRISGARLLICALDRFGQPSLEPRFTSRDYGARSASLSACWSVRSGAPLVARWAIVPVCRDEDETARLELISRLKERAGVEALSESNRELSV
ncbi:MAG TPA: heparinase II/III-family protein, partial [Pyrinomonadaceae bacterium]|nr:heparinase II/III-family protein [Pyrinomonadaceae bacterium]